MTEARRRHHSNGPAPPRCPEAARVHRRGGLAIGRALVARLLGLLALVVLVPNDARAVGSIQVMGLFPDKAVVEIDGKRLILSVGKPSPEGVRLISATSEAAILEVEGSRSTYRLGRRITTVFRPAQKQPAMQIWPSPRGMYQVVGSINGYPVNFLVDTGATLVAMNRNEASRLGIDYVAIGRPSRAKTANGVVDTYLITLARVKIGEIELRDVAASVVDGDFPVDVLLGNSFLNRLEMRRAGRMLELRKRP